MGKTQPRDKDVGSKFKLTLNGGGFIPDNLGEGEGIQGEAEVGPEGSSESEANRGN